MTYDEALVIVTELRGHGNAPFSIPEKRQIEEIYPQIMGRQFRKTSCRRCYHDAVIEMAVKLKRTKAMEQLPHCDYKLRAGFVLRHKQVDDGKIYTNANLTNEAAARYLELFPHKANMFEVIPEPKAAETAETPVQATEGPAEASVQPAPKKAKKAAKKHKK